MRESYKKEEKHADREPGERHDASNFRPPTSAGQMLPGRELTKASATDALAPPSARASARGASARSARGGARSARPEDDAALASMRSALGEPGGGSARYSARDTVRSSWSTARVEKTMVKLMREKEDLMARLQSVDEMLVHEEKEASKAQLMVKGRRGKR